MVLAELCEVCSGKLRSVVAANALWDSMPSEHHLHFAYHIARSCLSPLFCFDITGEIVHYHKIFPPTMFTKIRGYFLPWTIWQRSWYKWFRTVVLLADTCCTRVHNCFKLFTQSLPQHTHSSLRVSCIWLFLDVLHARDPRFRGATGRHNDS